MIIELVMAVAVVVAMVKIADMENQSSFIWGAVAVAALVLCFALPLPFFRVLVAGVISYAAMFVYKVVANK
jgi:hypothetical protein